MHEPGDATVPSCSAWRASNRAENVREEARDALGEDEEHGDKVDQSDDHGDESEDRGDTTKDG